MAAGRWLRRERGPFDRLTLASVVGNSDPRGVGGVLGTGEERVAN